MVMASIFERIKGLVAAVAGLVGIRTAEPAPERSDGPTLETGLSWLAE